MAQFLRSMIRLSLAVLVCALVRASAASVDADHASSVVNVAETILLSPPALEETTKKLKEYVAFASISAIDAYANQTRATADWLVEELRECGFPNAKLYNSGFKYPVVVGSSSPLESGKPSVVVYGHYDVQPVDPEHLWHSDPFTMERTQQGDLGEVFTGRGSSDDKGNSYAAVSALAVLNEIIDGGGLAALPINVILVLEGEEEIGSPGFRSFLVENKEIFKDTRLVLSADGSQPREDKGGLLLSLRGLVAAQIDIVGANTDLHSGTYGGSIVNPITAIGRLIQSMHDPETSRVALDGFYDTVDDLSDEERAELEQVDDEEEMQTLGVSAMIGEAGFTTSERRTIRPTLEVVGVWGGFQDEGIKTVLPSEAHAKIAFRLVSRQDPDQVYEQLQRHVDTLAPSLAPGLKVSLQRLNAGARPYNAVRHSIGNRIAGEVLDELYGGEKHFVFRMGGSIPATAYFHETIGVETVLLSFGGEGDQIHAPNERWQVKNLRLGQRAYIRMIVKLALALNGEPDSAPFVVTEDLRRLVEDEL